MHIIAGLVAFEQVKYVVELARALAQHPVVYRVDLLTRLIQDPQVDKEYGQPEECLYRSEQSGSLGGAYIVRLPCGRPEVYVRCRHPSVCAQPVLVWHSCGLAAWEIMHA